MKMKVISGKSPWLENSSHEQFVFFSAAGGAYFLPFVVEPEIIIFTAKGGKRIMLERNYEHPVMGERESRQAVKASGQMLVIAEKPNVARSIAEVLGSKGKKNGYLEGNGYTVTWCIGHLVEPFDPEGYNEEYKKWDYKDLPIIPDIWRYRAKEDTRKQYDVVEKLLNDKRFSEVCCATDAGREGETIFRKVYNLSGSRLPIKRLWISSMEECAIREGFENLRPGEEYESLFQAGICREKADWLVGMNATRLFTEIYGYDSDGNTPGKHTVYHIGRVQTPTLRMVVEREESIRDFVKEPYYTVHIVSEGLDAVSDKYRTREEAVQLADICMGGRCYVERITEENKNRAAPRLYDLTSLQRDANRLFGFTALQTSEYTQSLYEKKLCTYPRTDSQYLTDDMGDTAAEIVEAVSVKFFPLEQGCKPNINALINSRRVSDHHAIIPTMEITGLDISTLSDGESKILLMIANRLICAVSDPYRYKRVYIQVSCNNNNFTATGTRVSEPGYRKYEDMLKVSFHISEENTEDEADRMETDADIPDHLYQGMEISPFELVVKTGFTTPPRPFTEDTLLKYMENAGVQGRIRNDPFIQNMGADPSRPLPGTGEIEEDAERKGLGTPATRAEIIDKLVKSGYLRREKRNLRATALGEKLIHLVPEAVKSVDLSVEWEANLTRIKRGKMDPDIFMADVERMVTELAEDYRELAADAVSKRKIIPFESEYVGSCPNCGGRIVKGRYGLFCKEKCGMRLDCAYGKRLTENQIIALLKGDSINVTLRSRKGKDFDAVLTPKGVKPYSYDKEGKIVNGYQYDFEMAFPEKKKASS